MQKTAGWALIVTLLLVSGCAGPPRASLKGMGQVFPQIPVDLELIFTSNLAANYMPLAGPIETYKPYPVAAWTKKRLLHYVRNVSTKGAAPHMLEIALVDVRTDFQTIGRVDNFKEGNLVPAKYGKFQLLKNEIGPDLPERIEKVVGMTFEVSFSGGPLKTFTVEEVDILFRDADWPEWPWVHDYNALFMRCIEKSVAKVDQLVRGYLA